MTDVDSGAKAPANSRPRAATAAAVAVLVLLAGAIFGFARAPGLGTSSPSVAATTAGGAPRSGQRPVDPDVDLLAAMAPPQLPAPNAQTPPPDRDHLLIMIDTAADDHLIERALAHAVINAESTYDPFAVSPVGALGLMQVMPATAADYGVASAADLFDPAINLATGMRHLRRLLDKYEGDVGLAVMAYNAGENALDRAETNLTIRETLIYTDRVIRAYIANGGRADVARTLMKLEQLRIIGAAGVVQHIARKSIDLSATSLDGLPPLAMRNIQARQSADR